jgi:phosphatidylglycerophosphate synthase
MIEEAIVHRGRGLRVAGVDVTKRALLALAHAGVRRAAVVPDGDGLRADGDLARLGLTLVDEVGGAAFVVAPDTIFEPAIARRLAQAGGAAEVVDEAGAPCGLSLRAGDAPPWPVPREGQLCRSVGDVAAAERELFRRLKKPVDGPVARHLNRRLSLPITRLLLGTPVRPNHMSVFAGLVGLAGVAVAFQAASHGALIAAALLMQAQSILDGCDGEIARLKLQMSRAGEWLDNVTDDVLNVLFCAAIGVATARLTGFEAARWIGLAGALGYAVFMAVLNYQLVTVHRSGNPFAFRWFWQREGADLSATLARPGLGTVLRNLGRRDVMLLAFVVLFALRLPEVVTVWYALIGLTNFAPAVAHVALGGVAAARRAENR